MSAAAATATEAHPAGEPHYVWYACFGSNILYERFNCYLEGGRIAGMVADMPGSRDPTPPSRWTAWHDLPHRLFFAHSSPTWGGGGVAFVDVEADDDDEHTRDARDGLGTTFRLYRVTLEQFNDVLAQENGMKPGDPACEEISPDEATTLARAWQWEWDREQSAEEGAERAEERVERLERLEGEEGDGTRDGGGGAVHGGVVAASGPPAEMRAPSKRWYGYVKCVGSLEGEAVLTFTCPPEELRGFRGGALETNHPSEAYLGTIERGLVQAGMEVEAAREYLRARCDAPMSAAAAAGREDRAGV